MAQKLKSIKRTHLTHLSRAINSMETQLDEDTPDESNVAKYLKMVEEKYAKVVHDSEKLQDVLSEEADLEKEIDEMDALENKVIDIQHRAGEILVLSRQRKQNLEKAEKSEDSETLNATLGLIEKLKEDSEAARGNVTSQALNATLQLIEKLKTESTISRERSLLPCLSIPRFDGNIERYEEFIDAYESVVQRYDHVDNVEKFNLLKSHLDPPASELLEGFRITNAEYLAALQLFKDTYGNKSLLKKIRISKLLNIEHHDGKSSLRPIYNKIRTNIRALESLEVNAEDYSLFLIPIVCSKLSRDLNKKWYKRNNESINQLLEFIQDEVESTEGAIYLEDAFSTPPTPTGKKPHYDPQRSSLQSKPATASVLHTYSQKYCYYCQTDTHDTQTCKKLEQRTSHEVLEFLRSQNLCYCCMKRGHSSKKCYHKSSLLCKICSLNHHTFLHNKDFTAEEGKHETSSISNIVKMSTNASRQIRPKVIFQTARAYLKNEKHHKVKVNVLFDPCSDRSYVRKAISQQLNMKYHEESLCISGYSGKTDLAQVYKI